MSISVKIKGNKLTHEGFGVDHVVVGDPAFFVLDQQLNPAVNVSDLIVIRHYEDKSVYTWMRRNVRAADSQRPGATLAVGVAVPRGEHVANLFELLRQLVSHYIARYMRPISGEILSFTDVKENPDEFAAIVDSFPVSRYPYRPVTMNQRQDVIAYLYLDWTDISALLDDPMRQEFQPYGQIVLVPEPQASLSTFAINPRQPRTYSIIFNGKPTNNSISDPDSPINISLPETQRLKPASTSFTLNQVRKGEQIGAGVTIDDFNQVVNIRLQQEQKPLPPPPTGSGTINSTLRWILYSVAGVVILLVILLLLYFLFIKSEKPDNQSDAPAQEYCDPDADSEPIDEEVIEEEFEEKLNEETSGGISDNEEISSSANSGNNTEAAPESKAKDAPATSETKKTDSNKADNKAKNNAKNNPKASEKSGSDNTNSAKVAPESPVASTAGNQVKYDQYKSLLSDINFTKLEFDTLIGEYRTVGLSEKQQNEIAKLINIHNQIFSICEKKNSEPDEAIKQINAISGLPKAVKNYFAQFASMGADKQRMELRKISQTRKYKNN